MCVGLQSCASTHPCPWCTAVKQKLHEKGVSRTFGRIKECFKRWKDQGKGLKANAKYYGNKNKTSLIGDTISKKTYFNSTMKHTENCINEPLVTAEDDEPVLKYIPPPQLHMLIGRVPPQS